MLVAPLGLSWPVLPGNGSLPRLHKIPAHCGRNGYWGCHMLLLGLEGPVVSPVMTGFWASPTCRMGSAGSLIPSTLINCNTSRMRDFPSGVVGTDRQVPCLLFPLISLSPVDGLVWEMLV